MQHDEFIGQVQAKAKLPTRGDAEAATRATLETLGERIPEGAATNLAGQLPSEIGEHLRRTIEMGGVGSGERFDLDEFARRVAERGRMDEPTAVFRARVVLEVTGEATRDVLDKVRDSLPGELARLIDAGSTGGFRG